MFHTKQDISGEKFKQLNGDLIIYSGSNLFQGSGIFGVTANSYTVSTKLPPAISNQTATNAMRSIAYGNGLFVGVTQGTNQVQTSPDGINWTTRTAAANDGWISIVFSPDLNLFAAVAFGSSNIQTSPDGITWTLRTGAANANWFSITYGGGLFAAIETNNGGGTTKIQTSPDGITWTLRTGINGNWSSITYGAGKFVVVAQNNKVQTSPDGVTWTQQTAASNDGWNAVTYGGGLFVAVAVGTNKIQTSPDGVTWTLRNGTVSATWLAITYGAGMFVATSQGANVQKSLDGIVWEAIPGLISANRTGIVFGSVLFVSPSNSSFDTLVINTQPFKGIQYGQDFSSSFSARSLVDYGTLSGSTSAANGLSKVGKTTVLGGTFTGDTILDGNRTNHFNIANMSGITISSSNSKMEISSATGASSSGWIDIAYGNGIFVAIATGSNDIQTSPDGITWTLQTGAASDTWQSITYGNGLFVAVAFASTNIQTSPDGVTWTLQTGASAANWQSITYGGGQYIAIAQFSTNIQTSPDGVTWTLQTGAGSSNWTSITYGNGTYVVVSYSSNNIQTSPDGITWTSHTGAGSNNWISVTFGNGLFVAIANGNNSIQTSPNGITWTLRSGSSFESWNDITFGDGYFVAVSNPTAIQSSIDGINWTLENGGVGNSWGSVAFGVDKYVSVAGSSTNIEIIERKLVFEGVKYDTDYSRNFGKYSFIDKNFATGLTSGLIEGGINVGNGLSRVGTTIVLGGTFTGDTTLDGNRKNHFNISNISGVTVSSENYKFDFLQETGALGSSWQSIAYGAGLFVAVALGSNDIETSPDGIHWIIRTGATSSNWTSITFGGGLFVAVANGSSDIQTSPDGITWTLRTGAASDTWISVTYGGGKFVAVAQNSTNIQTSPDGITWTLRTGSAADTWNTIVYGGGIFLVMETGTNVQTSPDGITWTLHSNVITSDNWIAVAYGNGRFVAIGDGSNQTATSVDGITWIMSSAPVSEQWISMGYDSGAFFALSQNSQFIVTTIDGINWTYQDNAFAAANWQGMAFGNGKFVSIENNGSNYVQIIEKKLTFKGIQYGADYSANFKTRSLVDYGTLTGLTSVGNGLSRFGKTIVLGGTFTGDTILDGNRTNSLNISNMSGITVSNIGFDATIQSGLTGNWITIAHGAGKYVALSNGSNSIEYSSSGTTWIHTTGYTQPWQDITYGAGLFVGVAAGTNILETSPNGINWTSRTGITGDWRGITYGAGKFVVVALNSTDIQTSSNGINWTLRTGTTSDAWFSVIYGAGLFVAFTYGDNKIQTSPDGITWTLHTLPVSGYWKSVAYGNGIFVAADGLGGQIITSVDGINWTVSTGVPIIDSWYSLTYGNGLFIAASLSTTNVITSVDGNNWTVHTVPLAGSWVDIAFDGINSFAAIGNPTSSILLINSQNHFKGVEYSADFSANFTSNSLVNRGFTDGAYWPLGGSKSLFGDTKISASTHKLIISGGTWNFSLDPVNSRLIAGSNCQVTGGTINYTFGDTNINAGSFGSVTFGEHSEITINGGDSMVCGEGSFVDAYGGKSFARSGAIRDGASYSFIGGAFDNFAYGKTNLKSPQIGVNAYASFGFYATTSAQNDNDGLNAAASAIIGGFNHNLPSNSMRSVILGGNAIKAASGATDTVFMPKLRIGLGTSGSIPTGTSTSVLVLDQTTGEVKVSTTPANGYSIRQITGNTTINVNNQLLLVNTSTSSKIVTLPSTGTLYDGKYFIIKDKSGNAGTNNITVNPNGVNIDGGSSSIINTNYGSITVTYSSADNKYYVTGFVN